MTQLTRCQTKKSSTSFCRCPAVQNPFPMLPQGLRKIDLRDPCIPCGPCLHIPVKGLISACNNRTQSILPYHRVETSSPWDFSDGQTNRTFSAFGSMSRDVTKYERYVLDSHRLFSRFLPFKKERTPDFSVPTNHMIFPSWKDTRTHQKLTIDFQLVSVRSVYFLCPT